ncbi:hypothetical protein ACQQ6W_23285 [Lysinibacillus fusiformis]
MNNQYRIPNIGTFFDTKNMEAFWGYVAVLLKFIAPGVLIVVAIFVVGMIINAAIKAFRKGADDDDDRRKDDDEYDMRYY